MYLPPALLSYGKLSSAPDASILIPLNKWGQRFIVTATGNSQALMLDGQHAGHSMLRSQGEHYDGLRVAQVEIEVDPETAFVPSFMQQPLLSFVIGADGKGFVGRGDRPMGGGNEVIAWQGMPPQGNDEGVGFTTWRAYVRDGREKVVIHTHTGPAVEARG